MILVRPRRTEERHDAVALYLVDDAVVAMNGILQDASPRLQPPHRQFRITQAIDQARRISDVRKQHRKAFPLAAFGAQRAEQTLRRLIGAAPFRCQRRTALTAEAAGRPIDMVAGVALDAKRRTAAFAIVVANLV